MEIGAQTGKTQEQTAASRQKKTPDEHPRGTDPPDSAVLGPPDRRFLPYSCCSRVFGWALSASGSGRLRSSLAREQLSIERRSGLFFRATQSCGRAEEGGSAGMTMTRRRVRTYFRRRVLTFCAVGSLPSAPTISSHLQPCKIMSRAANRSLLPVSRRWLRSCYTVRAS